MIIMSKTLSLKKMMSKLTMDIRITAADAHAAPVSWHSMYEHGGRARCICEDLFDAVQLSHCDLK